MDKEASLFVDITQGAVKSALSTVDDLTTDAPSNFTSNTRKRAEGFM
jgi:hypothetical protein